jgi:hypothetical protein
MIQGIRWRLAIRAAASAATRGGEVDRIASKDSRRITSSAARTAAGASRSSGRGTEHVSHQRATLGSGSDRGDFLRRGLPLPASGEALAGSPHSRHEVEARVSTDVRMIRSSGTPRATTPASGLSA